VRRDGDGEDARTPLKPFRSRPRAGGWMRAVAQQRSVPFWLAVALGRRRAAERGARPQRRRSAALQHSAAAARGCGGRGRPGVAVLSVLRVRVAWLAWPLAGRAAERGAGEGRRQGDPRGSGTRSIASRRVASHRIASHARRGASASASGARPLA
jgi:hypothetical protein